MRVGILGGTGPAGRGLAVRLAAAGVAGGHRLAGRGRGPTPVAAELVAALARSPTWPSTGRDNEDAAAADLVVVATPWDSAVATVKPLAAGSGRQGRDLDGQRPGQGGPRDAGPDPAPGLGGRRRPGRPARVAGVGRRSTICRPRRWRTSTAPLEADVLVCSDHPEATDGHRGPGRPHRRAAAARCRQPGPGRAHRGVHRRALHPQHPAQGAHRRAAGRSTATAERCRHGGAARAGMRLYDTARQEVAPLEPGPVVTMYSCGITPYDAAHLGHAQVYLTFDMLQRRLRDARARDPVRAQRHRRRRRHPAQGPRARCPLPRPGRRGDGPVRRRHGRAGPPPGVVASPGPPRPSPRSCP